MNVPDRQIPSALAPPPLAEAKSRRWATTLNLFLPGAGLFYMGQRKLGAILAAAFLACLAAMLGIFLVGYVSYLNILGGDLMKEGQLEELSDLFRKRAPWLVGLMIAGVALQIISLISLYRARRSKGSVPV